MELYTIEGFKKDDLEHWGIKGMKWGERRFQYKDGSLTPAGKKRYSKGKAAAEKTKKILSKVFDDLEDMQRQQRETMEFLDRMSQQSMTAAMSSMSYATYSSMGMF